MAAGALTGVLGPEDEEALVLTELRARRDGLPSGSFYRAVWELACGAVADSIGTLRRAVLDDANDPAYDRWRVAVVAGDWATAQRAAKRVLEQPPPLVAGNAEYTSTLVALTAHDEATAVAHLRQLEAYRAGHAKFRGGQPSIVADIPAGIVGRNAEQVGRGLDALLTWHHRRARARSEIFNSPRAVICEDALVALLLARQYGLSVGIDPRYHSASVPLLALHVTEWKGHPIGGGIQLSLVTDLVARPWLEMHGIRVMPSVAKPTAKGGLRRSSRRARGAQVDLPVTQEYLRRLLARGVGPIWQRVSWHMLLGAEGSAREELREGLARARQLWEESRPRSGGVFGALRRAREAPNPNFVMDHLSLALAAREESDVRETSALVRRWLDEFTERVVRAGNPPLRRYESDRGYLRLIADLLDPSGTGPRDAVETVQALRSGVRAAAVGLATKDAALVNRGIYEMTEDHAANLERTGTAPPALAEMAIHVVVAAELLGIPTETDERWAHHRVPIAVRDDSGRQVGIGRVPLDLLGSALRAKSENSAI